MSTLAPRHVDTCGWRPGSSAGRRRVKPRRGRPLKPAVMPSIRTENARPSGLMAMGLSENTRQPLGRSSGSLRAAVKAELQSRLWSCSRSENQMKSPSTTGTSIGVSSVAADHVTVRLSCRLARNVYGGSALDCGGAVKEEEEEEEEDEPDDHAGCCAAQSARMPRNCRRKPRAFSAISWQRIGGSRTQRLSPSGSWMTSTYLRFLNTQKPIKERLVNWVPSLRALG
mmetsp:Transcript_53759/g.174808  ORF Transcript_53759/g.174808 Transcript_53759/m.174808 type:complete len:227 (+) Transcript_53759:609-1289(+)